MMIELAITITLLTIALQGQISESGMWLVDMAT
jgi:hypothetical protein